VEILCTNCLERVFWEILYACHTYRVRMVR
jgi:hypothetical protein